MEQVHIEASEATVPTLGAPYDAPRTREADAEARAAAEQQVERAERREAEPIEDEAVGRTVDVRA